MRSKYLIKQFYQQYKQMGGQGSCLSGKKQQNQSEVLDLKFDSKQSFYFSYTHSANTFKKTLYNWHCIPIITSIDFATTKMFTVKNCGIQKDNFVVGIIKKGALTSLLKMPWKTDSVICYQSHQQSGQSAIVYKNVPNRCGRGVLQNETLTVIIKRQQIQFRIGDQILGRKDIPRQFMNDQILPYVALFTEGDKIQFPMGIKEGKHR